MKLVMINLGINYTTYCSCASFVGIIGGLQPIFMGSKCKVGNIVHEIILLCVGECTGCLPFPFARFLSAYALLAVVLYLSATIIWPIFNFDPKHGGTKHRASSCSTTAGLCVWDKLMAVAVLTAVNFILYLADLIYSARLVFVSA